MKTTLAILISFVLQVCCLGQSNMNCTNDITIVERLAKVDSLVLWNPYAIQLSQTHYALLKNDYKIYNVAYWKSEREYKEHDCFIREMQALIENKFGIDILARTKVLADSLDRAKKGFIPPKPPAELIHELMTVLEDIQFEGKALPELTYFVFEFQLDVSGQVTSVYCKGYESKENLEFYFDTKSSSAKRINKALKSITWTAATFRGEPFPFRVLLPINLKAAGRQ